MKITILEALSVEEDLLRTMAEDIVDQGHELVIYEDLAEDIEEKKNRVKDTDILIIANSKLEAEVIESAKNLKYIAVAFTGVDHVDMDKCRELDIRVSNAAGYSTSSVAELVFGLIIDIYRNIGILDRKTRQGGSKEGFRHRDLYGKTLGVMGTGNIGSHLINIGQAFGCKILAYSRTEDEELKEKGVDYVSKEELLRESDIVSLHLPLNQGTKGIIGDEEFDLMKKDSILINAARGPIVDSDALYRALKENKIQAAGIDVFDTEPPLNKDLNLFELDNIVVTPHIGFFTEEAMIRRADITFDNIRAYLRGEILNKIN